MKHPAQLGAVDAPTNTRATRPLRVVVLGQGAIGEPVTRALREGRVAGAVLAATIDMPGIFDADGAPLLLEELPQRADVVVEAAGQQALAEYGPALVTADLDLLVLSVGALADEDLHLRLSGGPGRLFLSTGAIGGLDLLRAVADAGTLEKVTITTTKKPRTLVQDWMDNGQRAALLGATAPVEVLRGTAQRIATAFPRSANVAMAVAAASGDPAKVEAVVIADPACTLTTHEIAVASGSGSYWFRICNHPSPDNPATSGLVPFSVLRALQDLAGRRSTLI